MSTPFHQTTRALNSERLTVRNGLLAALMILCGLWVWWFCAGSVPVYRQAEARVITVADPYPVTPNRAGRVVAHGLRLNRRVKQGEVLLQLDPYAVQKALEQAAADVALHRDGEGQVAAALARQAQLAQADLNNADLRLSQIGLEIEEQALALAALEDKHTRYKRLRQRGEIAELEFLELDKDVEQARRRAEQLAIDRRLLVGERAQLVTKAADQRGDLERRRDQAARDLRTAQSEHERLQHELAQFSVRAPVDGVLADVRPLQVDAYVAEGSEWAVLLAEETTMVRAAFDPAAALGHLNAGDTAEMRLDGFPWIQHGTLKLVVREVAGEWRNGRVRVDFDVVDTPAGIPLQHGLPGTVVVTGERITPLQMLLRAVGGRATPVAAGPLP